MISFNEWNAVSLTFSEKFSILQSRLSSLSSACNGGNYVSSCYNPDPAKTTKELVDEIDAIWKELKTQALTNDKKKK